MAQFHRYSFRNQLLIGLQMPDATYVRGFKGWIDAGRCVRKGETSIRIFAPRPWQRETAVDEVGTLQVEEGISFAAVPVFDVSQTDPIPGHPHPWQPPQRHAASGNQSLAWTLWEAMLAHAGSYEYYLHFVTREQRSWGIGRLLLTSLIDRLLAFPQIATIRLWVTQTRNPARALYESVGFQVVGKTAEGIVIDDRQYDELIMEL